MVPACCPALRADGPDRDRPRGDSGRRGILARRIAGSDGVVMRFAFRSAAGRGVIFRSGTDLDVIVPVVVFDDAIVAFCNARARHAIPHPQVRPRGPDRRELRKHCGRGRCG